MTHTDTEQAIREIMESLGENIEYDQLVNKLVEKNIITADDVTRLNMLEDETKPQELLVTLLGKDPSYHPLVLKILETLKTPTPKNTMIAHQAIEQAGSNETGIGSRAVSRSERRILTNDEVSTNWQLKNFLIDLSKEISSEELEDMKDLMRGESGFQKNAVSKMERPMTFFRQLMQTGRLNAYNLHFLQALVRRIGRLDLNEKVRQFCLESNKTPIHFFTPSEVPENGYKYVRHHIEGDIDKLNPMERERLRAVIATALCVPLTFVFIKGIEPTASILITFMVPEEDVRSFIQIYVKEGPCSLHMSIHIHIEGEELSFAEGPPSSESSPSPMFQELKHLLEREQNLEDQLADRDEKLIDLQEKLENKEGERTLDQYCPDEAEGDQYSSGESQALDMYKGLVTRLVDVMATMQPRVSQNGSLRLSSALALYQRLLAQTVKHCGGDHELLNKLLDARVLVENMRRENTMKRMQEIMRMLTEKVEELREDNGFLRASGVIAGGSSSFLQDVLVVQANNSRLAIDQHREGHELREGHQLREIHQLQINELFGFGIVPVMQLREEDQIILAKMTHDLPKKDRQKLRDFLCFSDAEREQLKKDQTKLLELAVLREYRIGRHEQTPLDVVLRDILAKIKKGNMVERYLTSTKESIRKSPVGTKAVHTQLGEQMFKSPIAEGSTT